MTTSLFIDLFRIGLKPIPLLWDSTTKSATSHYIEHSKITDDNYTELTFGEWVTDVTKANGLAIKLFSPFGCIDFDLKNTDDKTVYDCWLKAICSQNDDIMSKICIEKTRNDGYHVYIKYPKLSSKISIAREEDGAEVIAIYTGGTLSYCSPTPGYNLVHNELIDLEELTDDEYDILVSCASTFDKYAPKETHGNTILSSYPLEYEAICLQFDKNINDDVFRVLVTELGLEEAPKYHYKKKDKFVAYLRTGSKASYSAKAYYGTKNLQLFTSSIAGFPCFNDRVDRNDTSWNLSPSKIIYYKNDSDWVATIEEIKLIAESAEIELIEQTPVTKQQNITTPDRLKFPYDIFPDQIKNYISCQNIQHEYLAGAMLAQASLYCGNNIALQANTHYFVKPILYMAIVAPPGASKTPAIKSVFSHAEKFDNKQFAEYVNEKIEYKQKLSDYKNQKKGDGIREPEAPKLRQILIKDTTIEMLIKILSFNESGCCLLADELSGFLKRMNRYGDNDEIQKWLEMWSGSPILMQRIGRDEDKVQNPFCTILGGIQPGVLDSLSSKDNEHNGFYHRFLFVYPEPQQKQDWSKHEMPDGVENDLRMFWDRLISLRNSARKYQLTDEANAMYAEWFNNKNRKYNFAPNDNVKGVIAKYQDYCLRFALIIQVMFDDGNYGTDVNHLCMERAIRLTEYFLGNMNKAMKILAPVSPIDKLSGIPLKFYQSLPVSFTANNAVKIAEELNIKPDYSRALIRRWCEKQNQVLTRSGEQKTAIYDKIY